MTVRTIERRGERRLIIDIRYKLSDGTRTRLRKDADVQTMFGARAEDKRRMMMLATTGSPIEAEEATKDVEVIVAVASFRDVTKSYLAKFAPSHLKPSTRIGYQKVLDSILLDELGDLPLNEIDATTARAVDARLVERNVALSTRRNAQIVIRSILCRYAIEAKLIAKAPQLPPLPKVGRKAVRALTHDEVQKILNAASPRQRRAFMLAGYAGLRAGEVRALRWRDVDLRAATLVVTENLCRGVVSTPKSGHERTIPLTPQLHAELELTKHRAPDAHVSTSQRDEALGEPSLNHAFHAVAKRVGLKGWSFHDLRHFFITSLFNSGAPAPVVQQLAGHEDLATTQRYCHVVAPDVSSAIARLGATVGHQFSTSQIGESAAE